MHAGHPAAVMALIAAAGCAGGLPAADVAATGGTPSVGDSSFLGRMNAICAQADAARAGHPFPVTGFNAERPNPAQLRAVGRYLSRYGGLPRTTAALYGLIPPGSEAAAWRRLLDLADRLTANAQRQIDAARARDVSTFVATVHAANALIRQVRTAGTGLGFVATSPCGRVYGQRPPVSAPVARS